MGSEMCIRDRYKYAVYYKSSDSDLIRRKVFKTRKSAMDFLGQINFVKSHEESTKESPLSIEEFKTYQHMSEIFGKYTNMSISQIFEAYSKYSNNLQDSFGENIDLAIDNFFKFDVSVTTSIFHWYRVGIVLKENRQLSIHIH